MPYPKICSDSVQKFQTGLTSVCKGQAFRLLCGAVNYGKKGFIVVDEVPLHKTWKEKLRKRINVA